MEDVDVLIVGAGLSGVGAAYHLMRACPERSFTILEGREAIGGTWDLFRYPGVRSDSDMYTLGYAFKPWTEARAIVDGATILNYVTETAREHGIDQRIRFKHKVKRAHWSSKQARWTVEAEHEGQVKRFGANFLLMCAGYYNCEEGYLPAFKGVERFGGRIVHPQHWPADLDYAGKRVAIIGSGATAVTLAPAMAEKAAHVAMVQRSPTYMVSMPAVDPLATNLRRVFPERVAYDINRFIRVSLSQFFFRLARGRPAATRKRLLGLLEQQLDPAYVEAHFTPRYNPWEQRLCLVPDNDMFDAIRFGGVSVITDTIETFTETGLKLSSGKEVEADLIVTATGLNLQMAGGAELRVDGKKVETGESYTYKGVMLSDVPNYANVFGYTNASWTLRADLISEYVCRLVNYLHEYGLASVTPRLKGAHEDIPFTDFSSGYFQRVAHLLPRQTTRAPWTQNQSYLRDLMALRYGKLEDGVLAFQSESAREPALSGG